MPAWTPSALPGQGFAGAPLTLAGWARRITGEPVIAVGSMTLDVDFKDGKTEATGGIAESVSRSGDAARVARSIADGEFDMVGVGAR